MVVVIGVVGASVVLGVSLHNVVLQQFAVGNVHMKSLLGHRFKQLFSGYM